MRTILFLLVMVLCVVVLMKRAQAQAGKSSLGARSVYDFKVKAIDGQEVSLSDYKGKVLLIVNTASQCGFTSQYKGLQELYVKYKDKGFEILGFPANDFMGQEPGSNEEIKKFCELKYRTSFPMFSKVSVKGEGMDPLYRYLTTETDFRGPITWNFNKFLVGKDGIVADRFDSRVEPMNSKIEEKIVELL